MPLKYYHNLIPKAKELRKTATKQENHLWYDFLCKYPVRFQRQKSIDRFIVDFYFFQAKLIIELDGSQHYSQEGLASDKERTEILQSYGLQVLRFSNTDVDIHFAQVCSYIDHVIKERM